MGEKEKLSIDLGEVAQLPPWQIHQLSCLFVMAKKQLPENSTFLELLGVVGKSKVNSD